MLTSNKNFNKETNNKDNFYYKNKKSTRNKIRCYQCKKFGHIASECRNKRVKQETTTFVEELSFAVYEKSSQPQIKWILDSGATSHMVNDIKQFIEYKEIKNVKLNMANEDTINVKGRGIVKLKLESGHIIKLLDVLYVPDLRSNLISVSKITNASYNVNFRENNALISNSKNEIIAKFEKKNGLYYIFSKENFYVNLVSQRENIELWHYRYCHINYKTLFQMIENNKIRGVNLKINSKDFPVCHVCIQGKQTRLPFNKKSKGRSKSVLELIHSDICGPIRAPSSSGCQYFITFIDDKSRWCEVYFMKNKSEVPKIFQIY